MKDMLVPFDDVDIHILSILQAHARTTMRDLGEKVGLSGPAVAERVRRLEERGVVRGYRADVAPERVGLPVVAFVSLAMPYEVRPASGFERQVQLMEAVVECYRVTGEDAYLLKVAVPDLDALREILDRLGEFGRTKASLVLSVAKRPAPLLPQPHRPLGSLSSGAD